LKHVVQYSGGAGSWAAAKRVVERFGTADVTLLFADVLDEDPDLYRFMADTAANVGVPVTRISDGRTPRQVMTDEKYIGNSRVDPCSKILKRQLLDKWRRDNCDPNDTICYIGIDWTEVNRFTRWARRIAPWRGAAPLCEESPMGKPDVLKWLVAEGIELPELYKLEFAHFNCGGACIKAGQAQWEKLLRFRPTTYDSWETWEEGMRETVGDHSILRDRTGGVSKPLTLKNFRLRIEAQGEFDREAWGGCGCAL
jgi:3'-phosphoadenosine 5'-phosphosulfate sulfotransferase (PAPS reductase)/FAD synthetase